MNLENVRVERIKLEEGPDKEPRYGFRLTHNMKFVELYVQEKDLLSKWID